MAGRPPPCFTARSSRERVVGSVNTLTKLDNLALREDGRSHLARPKDLS